MYDYYLESEIAEADKGTLQTMQAVSKLGLFHLNMCKKSVEKATVGVVEQEECLAAVIEFITEKERLIGCIEARIEEISSA